VIGRQGEKEMERRRDRETDCQAPSTTDHFQDVISFYTLQHTAIHCNTIQHTDGDRATGRQRDRETWLQGDMGWL